MVNIIFFGLDSVLLLNVDLEDKLLKGKFFVFVFHEIGLIPKMGVTSQ